MRKTYALVAAAVIALTFSSSCGWFASSRGIPVTKLPSKRLPNSIYTVEVDGDCPEDPEHEWRLRQLYSPKGQPSLCQYIRQNDVEGRVALSFLKTLVPGSEPVRDPPTLTVEGHNDASTWYKPLHQLAVKRFDIPSQLPDPPTSTTLVRVAVLDTARSTERKGETIDHDGHGVVMGKIIKMVACLDKPNCSVDVRYYPALPFLLEHDKLLLAEDGAGNLGSSADLSSQILRATDEWLALPTPRVPLIINMSLGWSGCYENSDSGRSHRVRQAIVYAQCKGAIVLAAGGNTDVVKGCPSDSNISTTAHDGRLHMYPGLWGGTPLTGKSCQERGLPGELGTAPLLLGIGAVDYRDYQLSITNHEADLASYGQSVAVRPDTSQWKGKWLSTTGTSPSTAAYSGLIALALRYNPTLSREALLELLFDSGVPLHGPRKDQVQAFICNRDYAGGCTEKQVQRLSVCKLLTAMKLTINQGSAPLRCTPLEAHALTQVRAPQLLERKAIVSTAIDCTNCTNCDTRCQYPSGSENQDGCDTPWRRKQDPPVGCSCGSGPSGTSQLATASVSLTKLPGVIYAEFPIDVKHMILQIETDAEANQMRSAGARRYYLGDAKANELHEWTVDLSRAKTARISYRMPGGSLEVVDVPLGNPATP